MKQNMIVDNPHLLNKRKCKTKLLWNLAKKYELKLLMVNLKIKIITNIKITNFRNRKKNLRN